MRILKLRRSFRKQRTHQEAGHHICHGLQAKLQNRRKHELQGLIFTPPTFTVR